MALEFEFPDTGEGVTEGTFLEWLVEEGEEVEEDETVAEVETDKAVVDVPAPASGTVKELRAAPGDNVEVGEVIMIMDGDSPESTDEEESEDDGGDTQDHVQVEDSSSGKGVLALPKVRKLAREEGIDLSEIEGSGPEGRITESDIGRKDDTGDREKPEIQASPAVRKLARRKDIDISGIDGSGRGGKVTREDVLAAADGEEKTLETEEAEAERVPLTSIEQSMAEKMEESKFTAPHVTHVDKADVTDLVELREKEKDSTDAHLTYLPFIMKAAALAMEDYPRINAELDEDEDEVILKKHYDFNIAVDTEKGLLTPLVERVDGESIVELAGEISKKAEKAKERELSPPELKVGTFSITNLGVIGGEEFTPIIEYPQVSILGIGKIQETAEVVEGEVEPRHTVKLSLSYDHRVIDGATAARFMNKVVENLEDPDRMLMEL